MNRNYLLLSLLVTISSSIQLYAQENEIGYFKSGYLGARQSSREKAHEIQNKYPESRIYTVQVPSKTDNDLTVDLLYIPGPEKQEKLLIISSGVHGIEGFVGNAVQSMFIDSFIDDDLLAETGIMLIHSVNPYGFKYLRRVSENNVDLNRNSSVDSATYSIVNEGYPKLYSFINPNGKVNTRSCGNRMFKIRAIFKIINASMPVLRQTVLQGQYQYPKGLYFGGKTFEPQIQALTPLIDSICEPYKIIFTTDLHSGYGERGKLHLFPNPVDSLTRSRMEPIFAGYPIDWGDTKDFYTVTGDFVNLTGELNRGKIFIPMTFEYGTMNSQTTKGSLNSIRIMVLENQGHQFGYRHEADSVKVKNDFIEMYNPSSEEWRLKVITDTWNMYKTILPRFLSIDFYKE
ncbi:MAG TPA: hypothetical protein DEQ03_18785 [Marinilabiliales bacterium]|nr:hypothetical protein [Marinilabiliales bacterium]